MTDCSQFRGKALTVCEKQLIFPESSCILRAREARPAQRVRSCKGNADLCVETCFNRACKRSIVYNLQELGSAAPNSGAPFLSAGPTAVFLRGRLAKLPQSAQYTPRGGFCKETAPNAKAHRLPPLKGEVSAKADGGVLKGKTAVLHYSLFTIIAPRQAAIPHPKYARISASFALTVPWIISSEPPPLPFSAALNSFAHARSFTLAEPMIYR